MANDCIPLYRPGNDLTCKAEGAITGKKCVQISGTMTSDPFGLADTAEGSVFEAGHPNATGALGAGKRILGVAAWDAADDALFTVYGGAGTVLPITAGAGITAGVEVEVEAGGTVKTLATGAAIGVAMKTCTATGDDLDCLVRLY